jgi:hypothetical protein
LVGWMYPGDSSGSNELYSRIIAAAEVEPWVGASSRFPSDVAVVLMTGFLIRLGHEGEEDSC